MKWLHFEIIGRRRIQPAKLKRVGVFPFVEVSACAKDIQQSFHFLNHSNFCLAKFITWCSKFKLLPRRHCLLGRWWAAWSGHVGGSICEWCSSRINRYRRQAFVRRGLSHVFKHRVRYCWLSNNKLAQFKLGHPHEWSIREM